MKNIIIYTITLSLVALSCQNELHELAAPQDEYSMDKDPELLWAQQYLRLHPQGDAFHYILHSEATPELQDTRLILGLGLILNQNQFDMNWHELDQFVKDFISQEEIEPLSYDPSISASLQFAAYETAHRAGLSSDSTPERNQMMEFYTDILLVQKGIDCEAIAELAVALRPFVPRDKYERYREYIIKVAEVEYKTAKNVLTKYRHQISTTDLSKSEQTIIQSEIVRHANRYWNAQSALQLVAS